MGAGGTNQNPGLIRTDWGRDSVFSEKITILGIANNGHLPNYMGETACKIKLRIDTQKQEMEGEESPGELEVLALPLMPRFLQTSHRT